MFVHSARLLLLAASLPLLRGELKVAKTFASITQAGRCQPGELDGVYHDLHDKNFKLITVSAAYEVSILPPKPASKYYVEGVGKDWAVIPSDVGPISSDCKVTDIDFNVPRKPAPPPGNVSAVWVFTPLKSIGWVQRCGPETLGSSVCGQAGSFPGRESQEPVIALVFGSLADAGNVWVKVAPLDPTPSTWVASTFTAAEQFERWNQFKVYGLPGTVGAENAVNRAAVLDGTCRLLQQRSGDYVWHNQALQERVAAALKATPSPEGQPSYFTMSASTALYKACFDPVIPKTVARVEYSIMQMASAAQNWFAALCAPPESSWWKGKYNPAYMPQQVALTAGFMCIVACDTNGKDLSAAAMAGLMVSGGAANSDICDTFGSEYWAELGNATSKDALASLLAPIVHKPCACDGVKP